MTKEKYLFFWGGVLSNFHKCTLMYDDYEFCSSEQLFMYLKAKEFNDLETLNKILNSSNPKEAKKLGREVKNFSPEIWDSVKENYMISVLITKVEQCIEFRKMLIKSKDYILVEASPYDKIWGIGFDENSAMGNKSNWGKNLLGKCLTYVRNQLIS